MVLVNDGSAVMLHRSVVGHLYRPERMVLLNSVWDTAPHCGSEENKQGGGTGEGQN